MKDIIKFFHETSRKFSALANNLYEITLNKQSTVPMQQKITTIPIVQIDPAKCIECSIMFAFIYCNRCDRSAIPQVRISLSLWNGQE